MIAAARLPGIQFEVVAPPASETLVRMDIAAFVGFAASGPLTGNWDGVDRGRPVSRAGAGGRDKLCCRFQSGGSLYVFSRRSRSRRPAALHLFRKRCRVLVFWGLGKTRASRLAARLSERA